MKRFLTITALIVLLSLCVAVFAQAEDVRPLEPGHNGIDYVNGQFRLAVKNVDKIESSGWFIADLYLEDHYDAKQVESLAPGDKVQVNGQAWTVREVVIHPADEPDQGETYEIYTEEDFDGYIVFLHAEDGCYICKTNDWTPVSPVCEFRITLPLPDKFMYFCGEDEEVMDADAFIDDLKVYGGDFNPYNTFCVIEDGMLVCVGHASYPVGPETAPDEDEEPVGSAAADESDGAVPVWKFCHGVRDGLETAVIRGYTTDCEEGPSEYEMTPEEIDEIRDIAICGVITGKASDISVTGGTWVYSFESPEGRHLLSIEMYRGWIVSVDGMYSYSK